MTYTHTHTGYGAAKAKKLNEDIYNVLREIREEEPKAKLSKLNRVKLLDGLNEWSYSIARD